MVNPTDSIKQIDVKSLFPYENICDPDICRIIKIKIKTDGTIKYN